MNRTKKEIAGALLFLLIMAAAAATSAKVGAEIVAVIEFNSTYKQASGGDTRAMFLLAELYELGVFCEQSSTEASYWYDRAARTDPKWDRSKWR